MLFQACSPKDNARLVVMMLEVLAFQSHTNDVVNSLETMERKIKEFERYANIEIQEFLRIGIVIRQAEDGPMRRHLIMNSHKIATFQNFNTEDDEREAGPECSDGKDGRRNGRGCVHEGIAPRRFQRCRKEKRTQRSCAGTTRRAIELPTAARNRDHDRGQSKGSKKGDCKGKGDKKKFKGKCYKCGKTGHMSKGCRYKETTEFEASEESLAETGCIDMASIDLNALEQCS